MSAPVPEPWSCSATTNVLGWSRSRHEITEVKTALAGIPFHVKLAIILGRNVTAEPLIESNGRLGLDHSQAHRMVHARRIGDQTIHHRGANALPLKPSVHEQLRNKKRAVSCFSL